MARESVPEFLNNMLALMVSLSKLFTKFQIFFAATPKRNTTVDSSKYVVLAGAVIAIPITAVGLAGKGRFRAVPLINGWRLNCNE